MAPLAFLVLTLLWLWPVPARLTTRIAYDPGDPVLNTWILWWNTQAIPFTERWWSPPIFFPVRGALAFSEHLFGISLFTTPLQLAGLNPIGAYNTALILSGWLSAVFAFLLGRRLTGSTAAAAVAGFAFAFAPYRAGHLSHLQVLTSQWMALALFAMHAYAEDRRARWLALLAFAWLVQALSNGYYLLFFPVLVAVWLAWFVRWRTDPRLGLTLLGTFAASSVLLLPSLLKYLEVHRSMGLGRVRGEMLLFSAEPASFLRMSYLLRFWPFVNPRTQEDFLFPGLTAILLVGIAGIVAWKRTTFRAAVSRRSPLLFYTLATVFMWWLALGPAPDGEPLQALIKPYTALTFLPGFDGLRSPSRFVMLACLTLAAAAALAFRRLTPASTPRRIGFAVMVFCGLVVDGWVESVPLIPPAGRLPVPDVKNVLVLELPPDEPSVAANAMFRMIDHRKPVISGYSGHSPPHYRILSNALRRDDPSAILHFAEGRPVIIAVDGRWDPGRALENVVRSLPGVQPLASSSAGRLFLLPAIPRPRVAAPGARIQPAEMRVEAREHVVYDLGASHIVRTVSFPLRWHFEEFHPHFEIESSADGVTWTRAWFGWTGGLAVAGALEDPREAPIRIQLPDVQARYLRLHPAQPWMTAELQIFAAR